MKRWLKNALSLNTLRKELGFTKTYAAVKFDLEVKIASKIEAQNVLILAPHPDDDCLAMGGSIKKMTSSGVKVAVAYFCDGSGGVPEGRPLGEEIGLAGRRDTDLIEIRKKEAREAGRILNLSEQIFWGYPDGKLASGTASIQALTDLIDRLKPDIIFLPSFLDNHGDHRVANEILFNAAKTLKEDFPIWSYEIWTPLFANRISDISLYIKTKLESIKAHQSQLKSRAYDKAIFGLNQYRAEINNLSGFAEGFFAAPLKIYKELYRKS